MKTSRSARGRATKILGVMVVASLLPWLVSNHASAAEPGAPESKGSATPTLATAKPSPEEAAKQKAWRESMSQAPLPKKGCYEATYPDSQWREVQCKVVPLVPYMPARGPRPDTVGNANDVSAQAPSGFISSATGSFDSVAGVTSESVSGNANTFSLQFNANTSTATPQTPACNGGAAGCVACQQFVYTSNGSNPGSFVMQYWLEGFGPTCPAGGGWSQTPQAPNDCFKNGPSTAAPNPISSIDEMGNMSLVATASAGGNDTLKLFLSGVQGAAIVNDDNIVNLTQFWNTAEFNVFGDCCLDQASFNSGSTIVPRTKIVYGGTAPPNCVATGFTGETNNLSFGPNAPPASRPGPAVLFTESSAGGAPSACASATSVGDTHLMTFDGVKYDFQAQGDFVLMQADSDFAVHTRQATAVADPRWIKNATIKKAVATQMGDTRVAICLNPARLLINGKLNDSMASSMISATASRFRSPAASTSHGRATCILLCAGAATA